MTKMERELRERIAAACGEYHGLSDRGLEQHIDGIVRVVLHARRRRQRDRKAATS